jgi:hypothetical protein
MAGLLPDCVLYADIPPVQGCPSGDAQMNLTRKRSAVYFHLHQVYHKNHNNLHSIYLSQARYILATQTGYYNYVCPPTWPQCFW